MGEPSSPGRSPTTIADLHLDALTLCASHLSIRDVSNMAMSCKYLSRAAYSDSIWFSLYRKEWPMAAVPCWNSASSIRETYISRHTSLHQFKYIDPLTFNMDVGIPPQDIILDKNSIIIAQGRSMRSLNIDDFMNHGTSTVLGSHNARITCMRLFSLSESLHQNESDKDANILVTSSSDHFIRLWSKGGSRCYKGHTGPVCTLSDKLLGDGIRNIFASGGEDGTVRLWSIHPSGNRGQHALKATFHGHEKAVSLMSVSGHKTSLLVSISKNGKVRVWDTAAASSSTRTSCCVGMKSVPPAPVGMKCHESLLYVAASSSVTAVDLRTMHRVFTVPQRSRIESFDALPSKLTFCTGGINWAMLCDIRRVSDTLKAHPSVELHGHVGPVELLHMDSHKVVTGGPRDHYIKIWDTNSGARINSLPCSNSGGLRPDLGCLAMAVDGCRIVTAGSSGENQIANASLCYRNFSTATCLVPSDENAAFSKFWEVGGSEDEDEDWPAF
ncbi:uncharacterized protein LOC127257773 [Andrographis paniculata]|uniref:uncharacterized protein LOC127257773 n=1 Tax=Andrographis paniculata TaxID=175694 RepID=UPI0021E6F3E4|nr:uncharacterized protein LOC127257773 [Andrographis paniculata]